MKILVVGAGGQTHALALALAASPGTRELYCVPASDGMVGVASLVALDPAEPADLAAWARVAKIDLVVSGDPTVSATGLAEALEAGEADQSPGPRALLPGAAAAARLDAGAWVETLLRGRGVEIATPLERAEVDTTVAFVALSDATTVRGLGAAWVYRRLEAGGRGPLTEGMGASAPPAGLPASVGAWLEEAILRPLVGALAAENLPYRGFLSVEAIVEPNGRGTPRLIAVTAGLHPMATQAVIPLLKTDLLLLLADVGEGTLERGEIAATGEAACAVTLVSEGYPDVMAYETGYGILGLEAPLPRAVTLLHEATRDPYRRRETLITPRDKNKGERATATGGLLGLFSFGRGRKERADTQARRGSTDPFSRLITAGGRVVTVVGRGATAAEARRSAYSAVESITYTGRVFRQDIGERSLDASPGGDAPAAAGTVPP